MATTQEIFEIQARLKGEEDLVKLEKDLETIDKQVQRLATRKDVLSGINSKQAQAEIKKLDVVLNAWLAKWKTKSGEKGALLDMGIGSVDLGKVSGKLNAVSGAASGVGAAGRAAGKGLKEGFASGGQGLLQASYAIDDLQYGLRGIINNISPMVAAFGGSAGIAGAAGIAAVAIKIFIDHWGELEKLWGGSHVKTEAEQIEELGKVLHKTAAEVIYYYNTKKKMEKEAESKTAFEGEKKKGTEGQELGTKKLSQRVSERGDLTTGATGADRLAGILGGGGIMPSVEPVDAGTLLKMEEARTNDQHTGTDDIKKFIDDLKHADMVVSQLGLSKPRAYRKGEAGFEEAQQKEIEIQQQRLQEAKGKAEEIYEKEVKPKIDALLGKLFNNPGELDYSKVQTYLNKMVGEIEKKTHETVDKQGNKLPPELSKEKAKAQTDFIKGVLADMAKTTPAAMAAEAEQDIKTKAKEMATKVTDGLKELTDLAPDAVDQAVQQAVQAFTQMKEPKNKTELDEVSKAADAAEKAITERTKVLKGIQENKDLEKRFQDRLAQFEDAMQGLEDTPNGMTDAIRNTANALKQKFAATPHFEQNFKGIDAEMDAAQEAIRRRQKEAGQENKRAAEAKRQSDERIRKASETMGDVPGLKQDAQDDAADRLRMNARNRQRAHDKAVQDRQRLIQEKVRSAGGDIRAGEAGTMAKAEIADAEKAAQEDRWKNAGARLKKKFPGMDENIMMQEGRGFLQGMNQRDIDRQLLPQIQKQVMQEGGANMNPKEAMRQAQQILDDAMKGFGQKLTNQSDDMTKTANKPEILGIKEYARKLQTDAGGQEVQKKQLSVQEQILAAVAKMRPDVVQQFGGAVFQ